MSDEPGFGPERYSTVEARELPGFDAGYAQAIKDAVEALRGRGRGPEGKGSNYKGLIYDDAADFIESRFSAPSPGPTEFDSQEAMRSGPRSYTPEQGEVIEEAVRTRAPLPEPPVPSPGPEGEGPRELFDRWAASMGGKEQAYDWLVEVAIPLLQREGALPEALSPQEAEAVQRVHEGAYYTDGAGLWRVVNVCALGAVDLEDADGNHLRSVGIDAFRRQFWLVFSLPGGLADGE